MTTKRGRDLEVRNKEKKKKNKGNFIGGVAEGEEHHLQKMKNGERQNIQENQEKGID